MSFVNDTICAIATAPGNGAIAVIRLSGPESVSVCDAIFSSHSGVLSEMLSHTLRFGLLKDGDVLLDEVVLSLFRAPKSYTGEDVVEISCHGSEYIQQRILQAFISRNIRLAQPGEFTQRAFLNGKMDLSQAEAVADVIASSSEVAHRIALHQMRGGFSDCLINLRAQLLDFTSLIELELDFSEEDVVFADRKALSVLTDDMDRVLEGLISSFSYGNVVKNGVPVAIVGKTNVGKSTLLNVLLNEDRAIVSDIHGTTRDAIEDVVILAGIRFRFIDTAGIRHTSDIVESLGIERTLEKIRQAKVVLLVVESELDSKDIAAQAESLGLQPDQHLLVLLNKADRMSPDVIASKREHLMALDVSAGLQVLALSAKFRQGIPELEQSLIRTVSIKESTGDEVVVTNVRHFEALQQARASLVRVREGLQSHLPADLLTQDIREVLYSLGTITGQITSNEVLDHIFDKFCIGK